MVNTPHNLEPAQRQALVQQRLSSLPYGIHLGLQAQIDAHGRLCLCMPFHESLIGSPLPRRLHGGTLGGLLEITGLMRVALELGPDTPIVPKPIGITIDYLRAGDPRDTYATATIERLGRTIANVRATAWQEGESRLISTAHMHILVEA
jgi:acyl-coenzyme A thioesterase PaaI-like protein